MEIKIFWNETETKNLLKNVKLAIDELWLWDFLKLTTTNCSNIKKDLNITKQPALIIQEDSIDFKDVIFEWITPDIEELKSMFISIIWWEESWDCSTYGCNSWCNGC